MCDATTQPVLGIGPTYQEQRCGGSAGTDQRSMRRLRLVKEHGKSHREVWHSTEVLVNAMLNGKKVKYRVEYRADESALCSLGVASRRD